MLAHSLLITAILFTSQAQPAPETGEAFVKRIESGHGRTAWYDKKAVQAEFAVDFGGQRMIEGTMTFTPSMGRVRMDLANGTTLLWDGATAWQSGPGFDDGRFHVLTWPYFLALPFKLSDKGAAVQPIAPLPFREERTLPAAELTFDTGVGDAPDDWYVLYRDGDRLAGAAYIVTYGKSREEGEKEPHAIVYGDYATIDGVAIPRQWTFFNWSREQGVLGDPAGRATLKSVRFVSPGRSTFAKPADAKELPRP